ncbi:flagellar protein FliT [Alicyclobacillus fructus]|uniref:flagellar protein FliT n=1 Tax=Alicyclobacillus fructus TaxID=2816082 RepID=UPI001A8E11F6|nr:flagellar protein FliT [Alicyclobacillus fructus]
MDANRCLTRMYEVGAQVIEAARVADDAWASERVRALLAERHALFAAWTSMEGDATDGETIQPLLRDILRQNDEIAQLLSRRREQVRHRVERIRATRSLLRSARVLRGVSRHIDLQG